MKAVDTAKRNKHYRCLEYDHDQTGDICLVACGMERCDPGVNFGPEVRDCYHLHAVLSGTGTLWAGGKVFHPHFGQMFLLKDNEEVQYTADVENPWRYCWVTYNGTDAARISEEIGFTDGIYCIDTSADAHEFFELVARMHEKPEMNYINDLRRSDVVEYIGFTRSYFTTIFRKHTGVSPQEYLLQCRFKNGCRLLAETDYPVQKIAEQVGYEDPLAFSKAFKKMYKMSPTAYREQN